MKDGKSPAMNHAPGLPCPQCGYRIQVTMPMLLSNRAIYCTGCGLELVIDREESAASLELLRKLQEGIEEAEKIRSSAIKATGKGTLKNVKRISEHNRNSKTEGDEG